MNKKYILPSILLLLVLLVGAGYWMQSNKRPAVKKPTAVMVAQPPAKKTVPARNRPVRAAATNRISKTSAVVLPPALQPESDALQQALDADRVQDIIRHAKALLASDNKDARVRAAEALAFSGFEGFADIAALLLDSDKEVADTARQAWNQMLNEMENENTKKKMLKSVAELVVSKDPEYLEEVISDASVDMTDNEVATLLVELYPQAGDNEESQKVIVEQLDNITMPDKESSDIDDAVKALNTWREENAEGIAEEQESAAEERENAEAAE